MKEYQLTWMDSRGDIHTRTVRAQTIANLRKQISKIYQKGNVTYDYDHDMTVVCNGKLIAKCRYSSFSVHRYIDGTYHYPVWWIVGRIHYNLYEDGSISRD